MDSPRVMSSISLKLKSFTVPTFFKFFAKCATTVAKSRSDSFFDLTRFSYSATVIVRFGCDPSIKSLMGFIVVSASESLGKSLDLLPERPIISLKLLIGDILNFPIGVI